MRRSDMAAKAGGPSERQDPADHDRLRGYVLAFALSVAALLFWYLGINRIGVSPFFLYLAAVTLTSWFGGFRPALFVAVLGVILSDLAYQVPGDFVVQYPRGIFQLVLFLTVALPVSWLNGQRLQLLVREREARRQFQRLAAEQTAMLSQMTEAVIFADATGRITFLNDVARHILGLDEHEGAGEPVSLLIRHLTVVDEAGNRVDPGNMILERVARGERLTGVERTIERSDGQRVIVQVSARQVVGHYGEVLGAVATMRDVTVEHELEREKQAILSSVVHDLKSPLATIKGAAQLLLRRVARMDLSGEEAEPLERGLHDINVKTDHMVTLIDRFLEAARRSPDETEQLELQRVDLVHLVRRAADVQDRASEQHHIVVDSAVPVLHGCWDPVRLERIVENLFSNAVKYSPRGGEVRALIRREGNDEDGTAVLTVTDPGIGIPEADQRRIFDRFYRARNVTDISGTGVGLAAVKRMVEVHGGEISLMSRENQGTTVSIRLPLYSGKGGALRRSSQS